MKRNRLEIRLLETSIVERTKTIASAEIKAETREETYWVKLASKGDMLTTASVRAGIIGDREASEKIHRLIDANL
ncbi:MAG TPA: DUF3568 family protein [Desulfosarcina sp.]|nr:DUF3568 family protein [Desulfosarcina sp.]